jgi:cytochrome oxidase Cu insertion factor (SCO1/SenC/PrrC family)
MKLIWALLFLTAVLAGSLWVWQGFGVDDRGFLRPRGPAAPPLQMPSGEGQKPAGSLLAVFGEAPDFSLTERSGRAFSKNDLVGKPWIADFIFTSCAGQCPLMSLQMKKLQSHFPAESDFRFVSFTVDPDRDTPEVLAQYADRYGAEKERWFFLTGPRPQMNRILNGFFLSPVDEPAMHSIRFILIDGEGQIRGYYDSSEAGAMKQLIHDAQILTRGPLTKGK